MGLDFELVDGQTPLDEEEKDGLLIPTIQLKAIRFKPTTEAGSHRPRLTLVKWRQE